MSAFILQTRSPNCSTLTKNSKDKQLTQAQTEEASCDCRPVAMETATHRNVSGYSPTLVMLGELQLDLVSICMACLPKLYHSRPELGRALPIIANPTSGNGYT